MKRFYLILMLALALHNVVMGQPYQSIFGSQSTAWNLFVEGVDVIYTDSVYVVGTATIDGKEYVEMFRTIGKQYLRATPDNSQVFFYCTRTNEEYLVMDLNLAVGDTFLIKYMSDFYAPDKLVVDSVYTLDGRKRIRFNYPFDIVDHHEHFEFIEGIGTNLGLFYQGNEFYYMLKTNFLLCVYHDGEAVYSHKHEHFLGQCFVYLPLRTDNLIYKESVCLSPNPTSGIFSIDSDIQLMPAGLVKVHSQSGTLVGMLRVGALPVQMDITSQPAGLYYVSLRMGNEIFTGKIVKTP